MERTADLVAAFIRARAVGPVVVVDHSMGTQVAVEVAARHPDLVQNVVLIAPTVNRRERTAQQGCGSHRISPSKALVSSSWARESVRAGPRLRAKMRAMLVHRPEIIYPRVRVPTLVLRGENDDVCPRSWCRFVAASLPHGRLAEVPGHGHETMIRDAEPAAAMIRTFVKRSVS